MQHGHFYIVKPSREIRGNHEYLRVTIFDSTTLNPICNGFADPAKHFNHRAALAAAIAEMNANGMKPGLFLWLADPAEVRA